MKSHKYLAVLGAGGFAAEVIEAAELAGWTVSGLYADGAASQGRTVMGVKCLGEISDFVNGPKAAYFIAIGNNEARQRLNHSLTSGGHEAIVLIHPNSSVSRTAVLSPGVYIGAGAFVGPQVKMGQHAIVNVGASIGHDAILEDWTQVCPGARVSGFAVLRTGAFMGSNAVLGPRGVMEEWSKLCAASFAPHSVKVRSLAVGVPARISSA